MTVGELIEKLQQFNPNMPVATNFDIFDDITVRIRTWTHSNWPYDKPDIDFVSIE